MASCGSEEEQSSCCPRGYIASGPSSLALRGYIHWRSQRPASTPSCGRHSKGQRCRRRLASTAPARAPAPFAAPARPLHGGDGKPRSRGLPAACFHRRLLRARSHGAWSCFCARVFIQRQAAIGLRGSRGEPAAPREEAGRQAFPAAAACGRLLPTFPLRAF